MASFDCFGTANNMPGKIVGGKTGNLNKNSILYRFVFRDKKKEASSIPKN